MGGTMDEEEAGIRLGSFITSERPGMVKRGLGSHQTSQPQSTHGNTYWPDYTHSLLVPWWSE